MKKTFIKIMPILAIVFSVLSFSSCKEKPVERKQATSCDFKVNFWFNDDILDIFDITINFTEDNGNVVSEIVTKENTITGIASSNEHMLEIDAPESSTLNYFSKEFKNNSFPTSLTYQVVYALKDNPKESCFYLEDNVLKCNLAYYNEHLCVNDRNMQVVNSMHSRMVIGLEKDNIEKWLDVQSKIYYRIEIDSDGYFVKDDE